MDRNTSCDNVINLNQGHCQLMSEQIDKLEDRIRDMERVLIEQANRLYETVTQKLDSLFEGGTIVEFGPFPGHEGHISVAGVPSISPNRAADEVLSTLRATREQLELLNRTITSIQLAR